ncbi:MAG: chromate transporter [Clostridiales bacterium]|nr:chromate transporter [Clostridia bacterium]MCR4883198.1 chromate transporter [Clostridiales bacterium]
MVQHESPKKRLLTLFFSMMYISAFTFGGGFVIVTFMKRRLVDELHWISDQEMLDMTAIAQSSPGAIAVNAAILVGWKIGGFPGMLCSVAGTILPPIIILSAVSMFYQLFAANHYVALVLKGMQSGVAAVILDAALSLGQKSLAGQTWVHFAIMICAFAATFFFHVNVIWIILGAAVIGIILALKARKEKPQ